MRRLRQQQQQQRKVKSFFITYSANSPCVAARCVMARAWTLTLVWQAETMGAYLESLAFFIFFCFFVMGMLVKR